MGQSQVSVDSVLNLGAFDLKRILKMDPEFLDGDGDHQHDESVTSFSITQAGDLDLDSLQRWIGELLKTKGVDIYRMKGVLAIAHSTERLVYQGVHMILNCSFDEPWKPDEPRENKLVFIGKNLDRAELLSTFEACLATPENTEKKRRTLRFSIGDKVQCKMRRGWMTGEVVATLYRDESMPPGSVATYQVKLDDSQLTRTGMYLLPNDREEFIRTA